MTRQVSPSFEATFYFKNLGRLNHLKLHNYWEETMRSKGFEVDADAPAYESPFYEESIKLFPRKFSCLGKD